MIITFVGENPLVVLTFASVQNWENVSSFQILSLKVVKLRRERASQVASFCTVHNAAVVKILPDSDRLNWVFRFEICFFFDLNNYLNRARKGQVARRAGEVLCNFRASCKTVPAGFVVHAKRGGAMER